jgi:hypothetical protein
VQVINFIGGHIFKQNKHNVMKKKRVWNLKQHKSKKKNEGPIWDNDPSQQLDPLTTFELFA